MSKKDKNNNMQKSGFTIEYAESDPKHGPWIVSHLPLLDGPIKYYIKSEFFIVRDSDGKIVDDYEEK